MRKISAEKGFTLVELLIVASILAVVGMVVYGTFARGVSLWQRITQPTVAEDVGLFFKNIGYDLRNSFKMTGLRFHGGRDEISFPTVVKQSTKDGIGDSIGRVTYTYDPRKREIYKSKASYSEAYHKRSGPQRLLADEIKSLRFEYFVYHADTEKYSWETSWQEGDRSFSEGEEENLPLLVKIEVGVPGEGGGQTFSKTIAVPAACCWPFADEVMR